tara:strand:- start:311 stop:808 length:498 start_codon:yes stop_codon:yes gene_type:complete
MNITKNLKKKFLSKETIISMLFIVIIFTLDRVSKIKIVNHQLDNNSIFINDYLNFHLIWNTGISFGLLSQNENIYYHFISFIIFLVIIFLIYLICKANFIEKSLFSIILGGAIGNFYDRLVYLAVPDFIDIHINDFHWFTFNIADIFITIGVICLISKDLILNKK